jgi:hypothetical protein
MRLPPFLAVFILFSVAARGQLHSSLRMKYISTRSDTVQLDTLSVSPLGFVLKDAGGQVIDTAAYSVDYARGRLAWRRGTAAPLPDSVLAVFRVFPMQLTAPAAHKDPSLIHPDASGLVNAYLYTPAEKTGFELLKSEGLRKSGNYSRGITFGNSQDVYVNSAFNLQLAGKLSDDVTILAAITDENLPLQPEGNTQQLQDFDKVFIQLSKDSTRLIAGDYDLQRPEGYFMNFTRKNQGGYITTGFRLNKKDSLSPVMHAGLSGAVSKGKYARNTVTPIEGNQGPYRLTGNNNETYLIVLAGSERVYIDGALLVRGAQEDYVIDYNTAELTFMPRRLITKDSRIVVEFEYSEKSYARSAIFFHDDLVASGLKLRLNVYSEQDSRNQPLLADLDSTRRSIMSEAGDHIDSAYYYTADSVQYSADEVLYFKKDTTTVNGTYPGIFVYSTSPDSARWRVTFSNVGQGHGDYVQDVTPANGRVFRWVEPVGGIHQGAFAPVMLLVTPKKQQLATLGGDFRLSPHWDGTAEFAASNNDINLFSTKDKGNDAGGAVRVTLRNRSALDHDSIPWTLHTEAGYEYTSVDFTPLERYRPVEFDRDWNISGPSGHDEHFISLSSALENAATGSLNYQLRSYLRGAAYRGLMNSVAAAFHPKQWTLNGGASYLSTDGETGSTRFLRHQADLSRRFGFLVLGVKESLEDNRFLGPLSDTLQANSQHFMEYTGYVTTSGLAKTTALLSYRHRVDGRPVGTTFRDATTAQEAALNLGITAGRQQIRTTTTYRQLKYADSAAAGQPPATLLSRIDYAGSLLKGGVSATAYYEISRGQEPKREYSYLEVAPGQGLYVWNDYNGNGIKELNEFEISAFASEANYIKVSVPTTQTVSTRGNQFSGVINVTPALFLQPRDGKTPFIARFSDQFSLGLDRRTTDEDFLSSLNPFTRSIDDSSLISTNSSFRNTLFFNRTHPVYGLDATVQKNANKSLLVNGFETRRQQAYSLNARWNLSAAFLLTAQGETGEKNNRSEYFSSRNYTIAYLRGEPKVTYQPGTAFRLSLSYESSRKENTYGDGGETAAGQQLNLEGRYSALRTGILSARFSLIHLTYNGEKNSSLAYDMLEGLSPGRNLTWGLTAQRNLGTSMQLSLNYEGRKSEGASVVHVGGMQFRAFF